MNSGTPVHESVSNDKDQSKDLFSHDGNEIIDLFLTQNKYKEIDTEDEIEII